MSVPVPRFSFVVAVHDPPIELLDACLRSLSAQTVSDWQLCLVDDSSTDPAVRSRLRAASGADGRVALLQRAVAGGIVAASNDGLTMATGEFVVLVDHDDRIEPATLEHIDATMRADPEIDVLYTDEDRVAADGSRADVFHKPDWSPERLRAQNYCAHLAVLRRSLVEEVGGFRTGLDGAHDHDLILRMTERARRIHHLPEVLYHRSVQARPAPDASAAGQRAVAEHLGRLGVDASVEHLSTPGHYRVRRRSSLSPPRASVVIPTAGITRPVWGVDRVLVVQAVRSLLDVTTYPDLEVIVVADPSTPEAVVAELGSLGAKVLHGKGPFNYSRRCNSGVEAASGEVLVLLNDDVLVEQPDWLDVMVGFFAEPDVGIVGARLLFADGTLQHGGMLLNEQPHHLFRGFAGDDPGPFGLLQIDREVSAVTGACLVTPRRVWDEVGGLPEEFAVAFNDLSYCLRVRATGRRVIWTAHATLYHFESQSRPVKVSQREIDLLYERWNEELHHDPYGNPNLAPRQAVWLPAERRSGWSALRAAWTRLGRSTTTRP